MKIKSEDIEAILAEADKKLQGLGLTIYWNVSFGRDGDAPNHISYNLSGGYPSHEDNNW